MKAIHVLVRANEHTPDEEYTPNDFEEAFVSENALCNVLTWLGCPTQGFAKYHSPEAMFTACERSIVI